MRLALVQMTSVLDYNKNLDEIRAILNPHKGKFDTIVLPECYYSFSDGKNPTPYLVSLNNEHFENIRKLAIEFNANLIGGSVAYLEDGKILNRVLNFDRDGKLIDFYDKINLFACDITKDGVRKKVDESIIYTHGHRPCIIEVEGLKIGIAVCFDLRFPDLLLNYYKEHCDLISFSSAFTVPTGKAHWEVLLRARAIEGQCYVIASAQVGRHNETVQTYGHSLFVSPWGEVITDLKESVGCQIVETDLEQIKETKSKVFVNFK